MAQSFGANFDHAGVAPVVEPAAGLHVLELWHGPTSAFKDMALQCMPLFFSEAIAMRRAAGVPDRRLSRPRGDVGRHGQGGARGLRRPGVTPASPSSIPPTASPTPAQADGHPARRQRVGLRRQGQLRRLPDRRSRPRSTTPTSTPSCAARTARRAVLGELHQLGSAAAADRRTTSAPTPTWSSRRRSDAGRADRRLRSHRQLRQHPGSLLRQADRRPDRAVSCAPRNENNVLSDFIGDRRVRHRRPAVRHHAVARPWTSSISSNLERLLFELGRDAEQVRGWMTDLNTQGRFVVDRDTFRR